MEKNAEAQGDFEWHVQLLRKQMAEAVIARGNLIEMLRILPAQGRFVEATAAATVLAEIDSRPTDDDLWGATLRDRDAYHEWADKLAQGIAKYFGAEIGEHSNMNCPWAEALDVIEYAEPFAGPGASELANRFLVWPLPNSLRAKFPGIERPIGAYMMDADEARAMFEHCLPGAEAVDEEAPQP